MYEIKVPATSANIGSGFDSLGIATDLYNYVWVDEYDGVSIQSMDDVVIPTTKENLIYKTISDFYKECGKHFAGVRITQKNDIPLTRGLGSSSACIVAGLLGANSMMGEVMTRDEIIHYAARLEGHPDNVAPALMGGLVTSAMYEGKIYWVKQEIKKDIALAAFVPDFELETKKARNVLPKTVSHSDAVYNLSRAALASVSLYSGKYENLKVAVDDRLHQPYRLDLIKGADKVFDIAYELSAYGVYISGSGPTIMALVKVDNEGFEAQATKLLAEAGLQNYSVRMLGIDNVGATVRSIGI